MVLFYLFLGNMSSSIFGIYSTKFIPQACCFLLKQFIQMLDSNLVSVKPKSHNGFYRGERYI